MKRLLKNDQQKFVRHRRALARAWAMVPLFLLAFSTAQGTSLPPEQYQAEKTVNDYMADGSEVGGSKQSDFDYATIDLRSEVWVDRSSEEIYNKGDELKVGFEVNQDAYAVVYRIDSEGLVTVLWPRSRFDDGFVFGAHEYDLPVSGGRSLHVSSREGEGYIEAIVSKYPFDLRNLEVDFHHEPAGEKFNFAVAGDPFLAMNEVNYAVTGLEDSGEFVVTNYAKYYVHQAVDHPRYLCSQCHVEEEVAYDPYLAECTLTIEYDYSWYNGWYDRYGYYPVYSNPVYVYIDPWTYNPWVNYWYTPSYYCAPWYGWGWGWGACYSWGYSPYYYGNSYYAYSSGYSRYRPLNRNNPSGGYDDARTKTREYTRGSEMVKRTGVSDSDRSSMANRTRGGTTNAQRGSGVGAERADRGSYRGADLNSRSRQSFEQVANGSSGRGGLRIRETGQSTSQRGGQTSQAASRRHTSGGQGRQAGLNPVSREVNNEWRGTTRTSGRGQSGSSVGQSSRRSNQGTSSGVGNTGVTNSRSRSGAANSSGTKSVQPRKRNTRVWNSSGSNRSGSRSSSGSSGSRSDVSPRRGSGSKATERSNSSSSSSGVSKGSGSRGKSSSSSSRSSGRSGGSSRSGSSGGSRSGGSSGGSSGSGRR